ncbi:family 61 glycoside hydrolase, partial [Pseudomassariella vexata]
MKFTFTTAFALAASVAPAFAHYNFNALIVNDEVTEEYVYVRKNTNSNSPVTDVTSNDFICNVGGLDSGSTTKTYDVAAGDQLGFTVMSDISHAGPVAVYLSKATGTAAAYDGSGDWFKIYELTTSSITADGLQWASNAITNFTFTLPTEVPSGEYLVRVEQIALHSPGAPQFYISCAQISVTSDSTATPSPAIAMPLYSGDEEGLTINIYSPIPTSYTPAGPALWPS